MIVKVKTLTGKEIPVELEASDKVYRVKELLEEKRRDPTIAAETDIPGETNVCVKWVPVGLTCLTRSLFFLLRISYTNKLISHSDDEQTISSAKLVDGMQLHLVLTLRGGF
ncbi:NEDD8 family protein RUB1 KNAG_0I00950 [Huiozyma naganishii CBS 8797]|uniref:Ubiquitin-like domain-containing protein n=1 Tax=Huiozyma naganishii (strain ATCC MYA-139 / BCRC 22969 / CBS 8797 / KCTC 17520 / NBRC 10181 / NCYC 3082 / Yp74L-3) TaxID=1071383 RepID=J7SA37_HUIN7|nr:hypothetical protein KNAG_0I00950 [Kazachstania naganishii CBS 8797]CCK71886.1 hypothetical protein KNAG_0I00950 [Kazachstania naganishii CBS 8797]